MTRLVAVDTNILIYAHLESFPEHAASLAAVEAILADRGGRLVLTVGILHEFLHVVTDARRFEPPLQVAEAIRLVRSYPARLNVEILASDATDLANALFLIEEHRLGRQRVADTLLAATLRRRGVRRILTRNVRDYALFDFLEPEDPTA